MSWNGARWPADICTYWHSLARLATGRALSDQHLQRCVAEVAAVWQASAPTPAFANG